MTYQGEFDTDVFHIEYLVAQNDVVVWTANTATPLS